MSELQATVRELIAHFAYDTGAVDSGVHDPVRRRELAARIDAAEENELRLELSRVLRDDYLSEDALAKRYGYEDAVEIGLWFRDGDYRGRP